MRGCRLPADIPQLSGLDLEFRRTLVESAGSPRLSELWGNLDGQIRALYLTTLENERADIVYVVAFHQQLLAALRSGDPRLAQQAVFEHYVRRDAEFMLAPAPPRASEGPVADQANQ